MGIDHVGDLDRSACIRLDREDPLAGHRQHFELPSGTLYFDGNSLGPLPRAAKRRLLAVCESEWATDLIASWNVHGWIDLPKHVGARIAPLVGAAPSEVIACDSVSVNLFKLLAAGFDMRPGRRVILCQADHFPTDRYIAQGLTDLLGGEHRLVPFEVDDLDDVLARHGSEAASVCLSHVDFRTGRLLGMASMTRRIQASGALVVWDLSHSVGALPVELNACGVDLAVGCGYKFLNGGPGAPAFLFVASRHQQEARTPLQGWLGHRDPFAFSADYEPAPGVDRFVCGTPTILGLAALDGALELFEDVDLELVRRKSMALGDLFLQLLEQGGVEQGGVEQGGVEQGGTGELEIVCPRRAEARGSQVTLRHAEGFAVMQALIRRGVVGDFRAPNLLRFGLTPLYQRYTDVYDAVETLLAVLASREYQHERFRRPLKVT